MEQKGTYTERILVIDDEVQILEAIKNFFSLHGIEVDAFNDPELAMKALKAKKNYSYKTVITDIRMPKKYGYELITEIHAYTPLTDVIIITGYSNMDYIIKCFERGAYDYFKKPLNDMKPLLDAVLNCFKRHERWLSKDGLL